MEYRGFEFFTSHAEGSPEYTLPDGRKKFFCEVYHAKDEGMKHLLDCFTLTEGSDIPANSEPDLIAALRKHIDENYEELKATAQFFGYPFEQEYLDEFLHNTDFSLLFHQKQALVTARAENRLVDPETLSGLIHFLDFIGDWAEKEGVFTYPPVDEKDILVNEIMELAKRDLNKKKYVEYALPVKDHRIHISVLEGSIHSMNPGKEFYWLEYLAAPNQFGRQNTFSGGADYNDWDVLQELCEDVVDQYIRYTEQKVSLDKAISSAAERTAPTPSATQKAPDLDIS